MGRPPAYDEDSLLSALTECLWDRGYAATPVSLLVEETGVNAASLYARYGSKKGIMLAALEAYAREAIESHRQLLAATPPGVGQIRAVLEHAMACFDDPKARGCFLVNTITSVSEDTPEFSLAVAEAMEIIRRMLREALEAAPDLLPGVKPDEAAAFVQIQIWGIKLLAKLHAAPATAESVIRQTLAALFTEEALSGAHGPD